MPRLGVLAAVGGVMLALIGLTIALLPDGRDATAASLASESSSASSTTITVDASNGEVAWGRLRWLLAGLGFSAVVLVTARQVMIAASPRPISTQAAQPPVPARQPAAQARLEEFGSVWIPDATQVSIGD